MKRLDLYARYEFAQKTREELVLDPAANGDDTIYPINAVTPGLNYDVARIGALNLAAEGQLSYYAADNRLTSLYGKHPMGGELFIRLYPRLMKMKM